MSSEQKGDIKVPAEEVEEEEEDEQDSRPAAAPSAKERAERAAAAEARLRGEPPPAAPPAVTAASSSTGSVSAQDAARAAVVGAAKASGVGQVDEATALLAAQTLEGANAGGAPAIRTTPNANNELTKSLSEQLECLICREIVYQPVSVLDCLHTFCGSCLTRWVATHPSNPECPTCRARARGTKDSHGHNSLRDVLLRMDPSLDRSEEEKAEMRRIYTPGSAIDLVQGGGAMSPATSGPQNHAMVQQPQQRDDLRPNFGPLGPMGMGRNPLFRPTVMMNPIDELNLMLRYYFPCPTCDPGNPFGYRCQHPIPDPRIIMLLGSQNGERPIPRTREGMPRDHCMCFNCKRPNLMPMRDRRQYPQDCCAICSERFCGNVLGFCGPIKQRNAREFRRIKDYEMPPKEGLIASTVGSFTSLFGSAPDRESVGTFMPHLFDGDIERIRSFDYYIHSHKKMTINDFYQAVVRHAIAQAPQAVVVGAEEQGMLRAPWQGVPGRHMQNTIRADSWVCIVCTKDLVEAHVRDWYNHELEIDPPRPPPPRPKQAAPPTPPKAQQSTGFFSSIKKGFNDLGAKLDELSSDPPPQIPPLPPTPLPATPPASSFADRQLLQGNQTPKYPTLLATSRDLDNHPVFLAIHHHASGAILPGKLCPNLKNPVRVAFDGKELVLSDKDRYETFLENKETMKWIRISNSQMPGDAIPVAAGMERDGRTPLYFACAWHEGLRCVGYSGPNTMGARIPFAGEEVTVQEDYEVLVWRQGQVA